MTEFAFYSIDIEPTTDPAGADPAPSTLVVLDQPPIFGDYNLHGGEVGRGTVIATMGGAVVQDFGVFSADERISFSEADALSPDTVDALKAIHETVDGEYCFTDGFDIWQVKFVRPGGFKYWRNLFWAHHGTDIFSYEINLVVTARLTSKRADCSLCLEVVSGS